MFICFLNTFWVEEGRICWVDLRIPDHVQLSTVLLTGRELLGAPPPSSKVPALSLHLVLGFTTSYQPKSLFSNLAYIGTTGDLWASLCFFLFYSSTCSELKQGKSDAIYSEPLESPKWAPEELHWWESFLVYGWFQSLPWWLQSVTLASLGLQALLPVPSQAKNGGMAEMASCFSISIFFFLY